MNLTCSEITLREALEKVDVFCPVKIMFNDVLLYDDYDEYLETKPPMEVVPSRLWQFEKYVVTSIIIDIVDYHHSIIMIEGKYKTEDDDAEEEE